MTDTTPPANPYGAPPPQPGAPVPGTPAEPAKKKGGPGRLIGIIVAVLVIGGFAVFQYVLPAIEDSRFKVDACLDYFPTGIFETDIDPQVVDCGSSDAQSRIVAVFEDSSTADMEELCPANATAGVQRDTTLYCIVEV